MYIFFFFLRPFLLTTLVFFSFFFFFFLFFSSSFTSLFFIFFVALRYELAEQLATKFKLRPRYYLLTKLKALVAAHAWTELEKMSNERSAQKELNGLYEFFKACFDQGNSQAALQFAIRIKDPSQRLDSFICLEIWDEAADMALELRDEMAKEMAIERIKKCCRDEDIRHIILAKFQNAPKVKKTRGFLGSLF